MVPSENRLSVTVGTVAVLSTVPEVRSVGPILWQEGVSKVSRREGRKRTLEYHRYLYRAHLK